jgi:DNA-binding GntR family transcriptional regulator
VDKFAEEHLAILEALQQRDSERAARLMQSHLKNSGQRLDELVESND